MEPYIIAIDQSTSATKVLLVDRQGRIIRRASHAHRQYYPRPDWVEQDAMEIFDNTVRGIFDVVQGMNPSDIAAVAITNQTGAFVLWDQATGEPVYPVVGWQCGRGQPVVDRMTPEELEIFRRSAGSSPSAFLPATKLRWLFEHEPSIYTRAKRGEILFGSMDCWLIWKLTGGKVHGIDYGNACITQLFNIFEQRWDADTLSLLEVPLTMLPQPIDSDGDFGVVSIKGLPKWPISGVIGDSNGALFGQCGFDEGSIKVTYGTGASILLNVGGQAVPARNGLLPVIAWRRGGVPTYVLEGTAVCAGASVNWMVEDLKLLENAGETEALARSVESTDGVYFVSAFTGLGTPYWDAGARGCIVGLGRGTKKAHIVRAALEGIAYQVTDMLYAGVGTSVAGRTMVVDGGASKNDFLMQFQADIAGVTVVRSGVEESSAMGAAYIAGIRQGIWPDTDAVRSLERSRCVYHPAMTREEAERLWTGWQTAVRKAF